MTNSLGLKNDIFDFHLIRAPRTGSKKDTYIKQQPSSFHYYEQTTTHLQSGCLRLLLPIHPKIEDHRKKKTKKTNKSRTANNEGPSKQIVAGEGNPRVRRRAGSAVAGTLAPPGAAAPSPTTGRCPHLFGPFLERGGGEWELGIGNWNRESGIGNYWRGWRNGLR